MAFFAKRPQQYRLGWPWNAAQVENADSMFETLFTRIGQLERLLNAKIAGVATTAGATNASPTLPRRLTTPTMSRICCLFPA
jgi:hypothetical protein